MIGENELIYTRDLSSSRIHKRWRMPGGNLATFEGCNLDDAGDFEVVDTLSADSDDEAFCKRCFPTDDQG
jgi:hypothetical protein